MKTLYITRGNNILVDAENNTVDRLAISRQSIDQIYLIELPMHVVYGSGEYHTEADVEKGDIVITFYHNTFKNQMIVVKNNELWVENLLEAKKKDQEEKERWAAAKMAEACTNTRQAIG